MPSRRTLGVGGCAGECAGGGARCFARGDARGAGGGAQTPQHPTLSLFVGGVSDGVGGHAWVPDMSRSPCCRSMTQRRRRGNPGRNPPIGCRTRSMRAPQPPWQRPSACRRHWSEVQGPARWVEPGEEK